MYGTLRTLATTMLVLLTASTAHAAPTLNAPTQESLADSRPLLSWTLANGEASSVVTVSTSEATTPDGSFFTENRAEGALVSDYETSWQPESRMPAGTYWWNLFWHATDFTATGYTPPSSFTIPSYMRSAKVGVNQYDYSPDQFNMSYVTNVRMVKATCDLKIGYRLIHRMRTSATGNAIGTRDSMTCSMRIPFKYRGKTLKVIVAVTADGKTARAARSFKAR